MTDDRGQRPADDADEGYAPESRAFLEPGLEITEVRVPMLSDERERVRALSERNGWDEREAAHIVFSRGLVALERETEETSDLEGKRLIDMRTAEERERFLLARLSDLESKYSVMKFTSFNALRANETLRMNVTGLKIEYRALSTTNAYLRGREDELRAKVAELERLVTERTARADGHPPPVRSRWERMKKLLRAMIDRPNGE